METLEKIKYRGYTINVFPDYDSESADPFECDVLGTWHFFLRGYSLGNSNLNSEEFQEFVKAERENLVAMLPIYAYIHSGIAITVGGGGNPFPDAQWDSGVAGYVTVTKDQLREWMGVSRITKKVRDSCIERLREFGRFYNEYLGGMVYGYSVVSPSGEEIESVWGFLDPDAEYGGTVQESKSTVDWHCNSQHPLFADVEKYVRVGAAV